MKYIAANITPGKYIIKVALTRIALQNIFFKNQIKKTPNQNAHDFWLKDFQYDFWSSMSFGGHIFTPYPPG